MRVLGGDLCFGVFELFFISGLPENWLTGEGIWDHPACSYGKGLGSIPKDSHVIPFGVCCVFFARGYRVATKENYTPLTEDILQHP